MFKLSFLIPLILILAGLPAFAALKSISYSKQPIDGITADIATIDLNDPAVLVTPAVATDQHDPRKGFRDFMADAHPQAQITGTFFDLHSGVPIGDIVVGGEQVFTSMGMGSALAITPDNRAFIVDPPAAAPRDWSPFESVLQGGIRLVRDGQYAVDPQGQGFHDKYMMRKTTRITVGTLPGNRLIFVAIGDPIFLPELAQVMIDLGCTDAMALDGGGSTSFSFGKKSLFCTCRKLSNVLMATYRPPDQMSWWRSINVDRPNGQSPYPVVNGRVVSKPLVNLRPREADDLLGAYLANAAELARMDEAALLRIPATGTAPATVPGGDVKPAGLERLLPWLSQDNPINDLMWSSFSLLHSLYAGAYFAANGR